MPRTWPPHPGNIPHRRPRSRDIEDTYHHELWRPAYLKREGGSILAARDGLRPPDPSPFYILLSAGFRAWRADWPFGRPVTDTCSPLTRRILALSPSITVVARQWRTRELKLPGEKSQA